MVLAEALVKALVRETRRIHCGVKAGGRGAGGWVVKEQELVLAEQPYATLKSRNNRPEKTRVFELALMYEG